MYKVSKVKKSLADRKVLCYSKNHKVFFLYGTVLKYSKDFVFLLSVSERFRHFCPRFKKSYKEISHLDEETFDVMSVMVNQKDLVKYKESCKTEEGEIDMCRAIEGIREEGRAEGESKLGLLISRLFADGRLEDVQKAADDEKARKELYREYKIAN